MQPWRFNSTAINFKDRITKLKEVSEKQEKEINVLKVEYKEKKEVFDLEQKVEQQKQTIESYRNYDPDKQHERMRHTDSIVVAIEFIFWMCVVFVLLFLIFVLLMR